MATTTTKKVKYVGTQEFINAETGELEVMQVTNIEERDFNFTKVWIANIVQALDLVGGQKIKVCTFIINNTNNENLFIGTQRQIADSAGVSYQTVNSTIKALLDADFLRKKQTGVYILNPDMLYKGSRNSRLNIMQQYQSQDYVPMTDEQKITNLISTIASLTKKLETLKSKIYKTA